MEALLNAKDRFEKGNPQGVKEVISIMECLTLTDFCSRHATPRWMPGCWRTRCSE